MLHIVDLVATGKAISSGASADMLLLMLRQRVNDRLPRLLPDDVQVAHKTGNLPGTVYDVGVIYGPASTIAMAALISETSDETAAATAIARLALAAYTYFEEQPPVPGRPTIPPAPSRPIPPVWREPHPPTPAPATLVAPTLAATDAPLLDLAVSPTPTVALPVSSPTPIAPPTSRPTAAPTPMTQLLQPTVAPTAKPGPPPQPTPTATSVPPPPTATSVPPALTKAPARPPATNTAPTSKR
jgi:hypothetical protein